MGEQNLLIGGIPTVFFGHSLGAVVAFELAALLAQEKRLVYT